jgi:hypothetical protein
LEYGHCILQSPNLPSHFSIALDQGGGRWEDAGFYPLLDSGGAQRLRKPSVLCEERHPGGALFNGGLSRWIAHGSW